MIGSFFVAGMNHLTAPVEVREQLALEEEKVREILTDLWGRGLFSEVMILSTCNRVEIYGVAEAPGKAAKRAFAGPAANRGWPLAASNRLPYTRTEAGPGHTSFASAPV